MQNFIAVELTLDDIPIPGFPYARRINAETEADLDPIGLNTGANPSDHPVIPTRGVSVVRGLVLRLTQPGTLRLNGALSGGIPLAAGAIVVIWETELDYSELANITVALGVGVELEVIGFACGDASVPSDGTGFGEGGFGEGDFGS